MSKFTGFTPSVDDASSFSVSVADFTGAGEEQDLGGVFGPAEEESLVSVSEAETELETPEQAQELADAQEREHIEERKEKGAKIAQEADNVKKTSEAAEAHNVPQPAGLDYKKVEAVGMGEPSEQAIQTAEAEVDSANAVASNITYKEVMKSMVGGLAVIAGATSASVIIAGLTNPEVQELAATTVESAQDAMKNIAKSVADGMNNIEKAADGTIIGSDRGLITDIGDDQHFNLRPLDTPGMGPAGISQGIV